MKLQSFCFSTLVLLACSGGNGNGNDAGNDAAGKTDAATNDAAHDAASNDAASNDASSNDASSNPDAAALVAQCQALALNFQTKCAGDDTRPCLWAAYGQLCATGQTQLLIDSMNCLDSTTCRTFSDANNGNACLDALHVTNEETAAAKTYTQDLCTMCGGECTTDIGSLEIFPYLTDADLAALSLCGGNECTPDSTWLTCAGAIPDMASFVSCY